MDTKEKAFKAFNHGTGQVDLSMHLNPKEMRPTEIHLKEDGSMSNEPVFTMVMEHPVFNACFGQISLEMLNEGLKELGYKIVKV